MAGFRVRAVWFAVAIVIGFDACVTVASAQSNSREASSAQSSSANDQYSAQRRPRVTVYPRNQPGPNSKRHCESWLEREYRISGTVIVPRMRCWWR